MAQTQPSIIDLLPPFDPTAYTQITAAQLYQLVAGSVANTGKGFVFSTDDNNDGTPNIPNTTTVPNWKNYLWRRVSSNGTGLYVWSDFANAWITVTLAGIAQNSITGGTTGMIALNTITDANIANNGLQWSKIAASAPPFVSQTDVMPAGDMIGSPFGALVLASSVVTGNKILDGTITANKYGIHSIDVTKLLAPNNPYFMYRVKSDGSGFEVIQPPQIFTGAIGLGIAGVGSAASLAGQAGKFAQVRNDETDWQFATPTGGAIVASTRNLITAVGTSAVTIAATPCSTTLMRIVADSITLKDANGNYASISFSAGFSLNFNLGAAALLGPDTTVTYTSSKPVTGWYYIWALSDGAALKTLVFSTSATTPTGALISSYTYQALIGVVRINNTVGTITTQNQYQIDRTIFLLPSDNNTSCTNNATPGTSTLLSTSSVDIRNVLPPIVKTVRITTQNTSGTGFATAGVSVQDTALSFFGQTYGTSGTTQVQLGVGTHEIPVQSTATLAMISTAVSTIVAYAVNKYTI